MKLLDRFRARVSSSVPASQAPARPWARPAAAFDVPASWMQLPALRSAGWLVDVVGESFNQEAIEMACGGRWESGAVVPLVTAQLVREPDNPYDANAVRVDIGGLPCGHIARAEAPRYHRTIQALAEIGRPATCRARITGGWDRGVLDRGYFGVKLDLHPNLELGERGAILPFGDGRVTVQGEEKVQDYLGGLIGIADRLETIAVLGEPAERMGVWVNGQQVGTLTPKMSERYGPWVAEVQEALLSASSEARIIRGEKQIEVFLKLARPWDVV